MQTKGLKSPKKAEPLRPKVKIDRPGLLRPSMTRFVLVIKSKFNREIMTATAVLDGSTMMTVVLAIVIYLMKP